MAGLQAILRSITEDQRLQDEYRNKHAENQGLIAQVAANDTLDEANVTVELFKSMFMDSVNGSDQIKKTSVQVEYIRNNQKLLIPLALGQHPLLEPQGGRWTANQETLRSRYLKLAALSYAEIRSLVATEAAANGARALIDNAALPAPPITAVKQDWKSLEWSNDEDENPDYNMDITFATISAALQFNCDIRDFGYLYSADATVEDGAWKTAAQVPEERLQCKLKPYTIYCIAGINLPQVAECEVAAWARAVGLAIGVLPARNSKSQIEYSFYGPNPALPNINRIVAWKAQYEPPMFTLGANVLAMFGLFHLNKDHTYRTADANMGRIGTSYLNTLRTIVGSDLHQTFDSHKEALVRTGPHPFGLAQTYWLAKVMHRHNFLASPLMIRHDTTPPPVQRLMIVNAAIGEWGAFPVGKQIQQLYGMEWEAAKATIELVKNQAPAYSALHRLYDIAEQEQIPPQIAEAVSYVLPAVYGYVMVAHIDENNQRDGLGHALSLQNVARDQRGAVLMWKNAWDGYISRAEAQPMEAFIQSMAPVVQAQQLPPAP